MEYAYYSFAKALSPNVGKLSNPQPSAAAKNHLKKAHKKLMEKYFPNTFTCFLKQRKSIITVSSCRARR